MPLNNARAKSTSSELVDPSGWITAIGEH